MAAWTTQINKHKVILPRNITPEMNGKVPPALRRDVFNGKGVRFGTLAIPAARSWAVMRAHALRDGVPAASINCTDSYREYATQERIFRERYTTTPTKMGDGKYHTKTWLGKTWYQKPGTAAAAVPGTSNHGKAVAIDKGDGSAFHAWLEIHAAAYGWEWELASERWHLHYWPGDVIPQTVLDYEKNNNTTTPEDPFMALSDKEQRELLDNSRKQIVRYAALGEKTEHYYVRHGIVAKHIPDNETLQMLVGAGLILVPSVWTGEHLRWVAFLDGPLKNV